MKPNIFKPKKAWVVSSADGWDTSEIFPRRSVAQDYYSRVKMSGTLIIPVLITPIQKSSKS